MTSSTAASTATKQAVIYLRVSTPRQMHTANDIDPEGNSIATRRETCLAKAHSLDAATTKRALSLLDIRIISCKEDFGTGPVADAMETVSDAFNELMVRQNGEDIKQKLRHKALNGGTISRAKLGYLNVRVSVDGRLVNSIGLDPERATLVAKAFELYASGDYSIDRLEATMADLGLTTRPSGRWPTPQPISDSKLHRMLSDPYYAGGVVVDGHLVSGRHEPIISQELFDKVQEVLANDPGAASATACLSTTSRAPSIAPVAGSRAAPAA